MSERVWDRFLTAPDRASLGAISDRRVGFGTQPAVLLVDMYRGVFGDEPQPLLESIKLWPASCGLAGWRALPHIQLLLGDARAAGIPIVHLTGLADSGMVGWVDAIHADSARPSGGQSAADRFARRYQIIDEVAPAPGEVVLRKVGPSAFWGTPLVGHLTHLGIDTLVIAGETTSGCVRATVVDGASHRFRVTVVEECVFDRHETTHAINLFDMHQKYADVLPLAEVRPLLKRNP